MSALHWAAFHNNVPLVKLLLKHGANINLECCGEHCNSRDTPLNEAATRGHLDVVNFLIAQEGIKWGTEKTGENCINNQRGGPGLLPVRVKVALTIRET